MLPAVGFGYLLDDRVAFAQEVAHIAVEDESFGNDSNHGDGCGVAEDVAHLGEAVGEFEEEVVVLHPCERAGEHRVLEGVGRIELRDVAGESLADTEVASLPCHLVAEPEEAGRTAVERDCQLAEVDVTQDVDLYRAGQVEAEFDGSVDQRHFFEGGHEAPQEWQRCYGKRWIYQLSA